MHNYNILLIVLNIEFIMQDVADNYQVQLVGFL